MSSNIAVVLNLKSRYGRFCAAVNAVAVASLFLFAGPVQAADAQKLLILGDSLTAGYGLPQAESFPSQLEKALQEEGLAVSVINAGVSGDTTAGGLARLDWALNDRPDAAVVELGANDGLRGLDPGQSEANLAAILDRLKEEGTPVLLAGMLAPPNLGQRYGKAFNGMYERLGARDGVIFYPFFLEGVAADPGLNQADGIHPNKQGVAVIVERILPAVKKLMTVARKK